MTAVVSEVLKIICRALGVEALPAGDVARVEQWSELPGFTVDRFRKLVLETQRRGVKVSSARYWEGAVYETFRSGPLTAPSARPRLASELPWSEYLSRDINQYGTPDAQMLEHLRFRWERERSVLGLPIEEEVSNEIPGVAPDLSGREPTADPLPLAA